MAEADWLVWTHNGRMRQRNYLPIYPLGYDIARQRLGSKVLRLGLGRAILYARLPRSERSSAT